MKKVYLAVPYTGMKESAFAQVNEATASILRNSINVFSPISHSHHLSVNFDLPGDWEFWKEVDLQFIDWCNELWVLIPTEGYDKVKESVGVQAEIEYAEKTGKPVFYVKVLNGEYVFAQKTEE